MLTLMNFWLVLILPIIIINELIILKPNAANSKTIPYSDFISPLFSSLSNDTFDINKKDTIPIHFTRGKIQIKNKNNAGLLDGLLKILSNSLSISINIINNEITSNTNKTILAFSKLDEIMQRSDNSELLHDKLLKQV